MNINKNRHKLLGLLSEQYFNRQFENQDTYLSFDFIKTNMKVSDRELMLLYSKLHEDKEADFYSVSGNEGLYATDKGVTSFSEKKYVLENEKIFFDRLKNWTQIIIPILSLSATILVITLSEIRINKKQEDINELNKRVKELETMVKSHKPAINKK